VIPAVSVVNWPTFSSKTLAKPFPLCGHARKIREMLKLALKAGRAAEN
jgi:hypothetical protein